ncbi:MAG: fibronectin type III-like domain-contianing protein, partial [Gordonia sp. (in: high G+C Gram-positive bacteria)]|uniref:fibronectin type III-like domain-contianing protein n=1 Tax=Gordonia sp. (in: high G+C Gram-positive bacteria) TaxID=84139 RepID=UPI003BB7B1A5
PRTVVIVNHGGVVDLTGVTAPALLDAALLGQAGGSALTDVLFGDVNPSGRLAETVPLRLQDTAAYLNFPGEHGHVTYGEGIFVGYRWYDARELDVCFPFGHGLSYTTFAYSDLTITPTGSGLRVELTVTNTGHRDGRDVVQVYIGKPDSAVARPVRELKGFANVEVAQQSSSWVTIEIPHDDLAYWDTRFDRFMVEPGAYTVSVGASSRAIALTATVELAGDVSRLPLSMNSSIGEVLADPAAAAAFGPVFEAMTAGMGGDGTNALGVDLISIMGSIPVGRLATFSGGALSPQILQQLLDEANRAGSVRTVPAG